MSFLSEEKSLNNIYPGQERCTWLPNYTTTRCLSFHLKDAAYRQRAEKCLKACQVQEEDYQNRQSQNLLKPE